MEKGFVWLRRLVSLLLCVALICTNAFAATESASTTGIVVQLSTPKDTYKAGEEIGVRLHVVNYSMGTVTGNYTVTLPDGIALTENTAGEIYLTGGEKQTITLGNYPETNYIFSEDDVETVAEFGDEAYAGIPAQATPTDVNVRAITLGNYRETKTVEVSKTIKIDGKEATITAKVECALQTEANADPYLFKAVDGSVVLEAEDCFVDNDYFVVKNYVYASGGKAVYCAKGSADNTYEIDAALERQMGFDFVADETAQYNLWVRTYVPHDHTWIYQSLNGAVYRNTSMHAYGVSESTTDLIWQSIGTVRVEKGEVVEVRLRSRVTNCYIDKIMITNNLSYVPTDADALPPVADWYAATEFDTELYADPKVYPAVGDHPRLFFHQDEVEEIRNKFYDPFNAEVAEALCETAAMDFDGVWDINNESNYKATDLGIIECKAFYYALFKNDPNPETRERAIKYGKQAIVAIKNCQETFTYSGNSLRARGHVLYVTALVYDWCYDILTQKDKARLATGGQFISNGMEIGFPPISQEAVNGHGAEKQLLRDWLAFSIAVYDEFPSMYELVGGRFFEEYVPARNKYWATSQYHYQGTKYGAYRSVADIMGQLLIYRMADVDYTEDPNFVYDESFNKLAYQWIYAKRPDERFMRDGDGGSTFVIADYYAVLFYSAMLYKDPVLYEEFLSIDGTMTTYSYAENLTPAMILTLQDPSVENMESDVLPYTHYHKSPYGMLVARTGLEYNNLNSNDVIANMKIQESFVGGHQNREAGSFQIYYKGMLTGDSGYYGNFGTDHDTSYQSQSVSKNTLVITSAANPNGYQTSLEDTKNPGNSGTVLGVEYGNNIYRPEYSYISGDVAKAYDDNIQEAVRNMLFLNLNLDGYTDTPGALIVLDQIKTKEANSKKSFLLHTHAEPSITDRKVITVESTESGYNGRLTNQVLYVGTADKADANYTVHSIGGEGKEFWAAGANHPNENPPTSENEAGWGRTEITTTATANNQTDYMLNVMYVSKADGSKAVIPATLVRGTGLMGAQILGNVAMFNMNGNNRISGTTSFQIPAAEGYGEFEVNVAGMKAGTWRVTAGNNSFEVVATREGGMLYFTAPAGTVTLTYVAEPVITEEGVEDTFGKFDTTTPDVFNKLTITGVAKLPGISLVKNYDDLVGSSWKTKALPKTVRVTLSDGTTAEVPVKWDVTPLGDISKQGKYILDGKLTTKDYATNGLVAKQFVTIHEYRNLIPNNADFGKTATASYGALYFINWGVYDKYFDQYNVTAVDNGEYGQAAKYIARMENITDNGEIVKHTGTKNLLANIKAAGSGQYLLSIDAWTDAEYSINFWPQLNLKYGSTTVPLKGTQRPFAAYSRTATGVVDIDVADLTEVEFSVRKNVMQVPYVCLDNAAVIPLKLFVDIENCEHNYEVTGTTNATCTEAATIIYTCSHCLDSYTEKTAEATGHSHKAVVTAPTCTAAGYTTYTCACGDTYKGNEVAATGHSYDEVVTAPTCTTAGYTTYTCACGDTYKGNEVAATGHSYTYTENGDNHIVGCKNCDLNEIAAHKYEAGKCACGAEEEPEVHEHAWGEGVVLVAPTYSTTGKIQYTCSCSATKTEVLPVLFYGTTVNLGNTLDLTFYFYDKIADGNCKAVFVRERADGTTETTEARLSTFRKNGSFYEIVYPGVAAKEMSDNVHLTIYDTNGNAVSETKTDSVRAYAMRMLRNVKYANDAKLRTMLVDMLNYGAAAQVAFKNYGINDLANKLLTEEEKALATPSAQAYTNNRTISGKAAAYYGSTCILESRISFVMYVYAAQIGEGAYAEVTYTDYLGREQSAMAECIPQSGYYQFNLDKIVVADSRCMLKWDFYNGNDELIVSVEDSLESYIARMAANNPWLEKVLIFTDSARAYLQK